ncbi:hypothetical protein D3C81_1319690 [compost metagenome]
MLAPTAIVRLQRSKQRMGQRRQAREMHLQVRTAPRQQQGRLIRDLLRQVVRADFVDRPLISQRPSQWRQHRYAIKQITLRVVRRLALVAQEQRGLHPFVVRQLRHPGRQVEGSATACFEEVEKFCRYFGEQRCLTTVVGVEGLNQRLPFLRPEAGTHHRKATRQQRLHVAEKQLPVHRQTPRLDAGWRRVVLRVAHIARHAQQLLMQHLMHGAPPASGWQLAGADESARPRSAAPSAAGN